MNPRRIDRNLVITRAYLLGFDSVYLGRWFGLHDDTVRHHVRETCRYLNEAVYFSLSPGVNRRTGDFYPPRLERLRANAHLFLEFAYGRAH